MKLGDFNKIVVASMAAATLISPVQSILGAHQVYAATQLQQAKTLTQKQTLSQSDLQKQQVQLDQAAQNADKADAAYVNTGEFTTKRQARSSATLKQHAVDFSKFVFLSDQDYVSGDNISYSGWGDIRKNVNVDGSPLTLLVNGKSQVFSKGIGIHTDSSLVYDISKFSNEFTNLSVYAGVDYYRIGTQTDGASFKVSVSNDLNSGWKELKSIDKLTPDQEAAYINVSVKGYKYLKLETNKLGTQNDDHCDWADLRLVKDNYDVNNEQSYNGLMTVEQYDQILSKNTPEDNYKNHRDLVLQRELVSRLGYDNIQALSKTVDGVSQALDWLKKDTDSLQLLIEAGNFFNGNGYNATVALGRLYKAHKDDLGNEGDKLVYKKMLLATVAAYSKNIKTFLVNYGGNAEWSDPVVKYEKFKWLYDHNRFVRKDEFKTYPMELVRYVMDSKMDDSEIIWLSDKLEKDIPDRNSSQRLSGYQFVHYVNTGYGKPEFYDQANYDKWNQKYDLASHGISYGKANLYHLWMLMEAGGICWGISGIGSNMAEVQGIPSVNTYQPQHEAYLIYKQNKDGKGMWDIWNNIFGWKSSYSRWGATNETQARLLLGWGCMDFNTLKGNNTTYILLAQAALNDYDNYKKSMLYNLISHSYADGSAQQNQALNDSLNNLKINLDSIYGLIKSYKANPKTTQEQWKELAKRIVDAYTFYPAPMVDLLALVQQNVTEATIKADIEGMKQAALTTASQATDEQSLQASACREIAQDLLKRSTVNLASFSFDGDNAGKIVLDKSYDGYQLMTRVSLDGGKTWEKFGNNDYTADHVITLSPAQLAKINATDGITVGLVGTNTTSKIDIQEGQAVTGVYVNDNENLLLGDTANLEYSVDNGQTWKDYDGSLTSTTRIDGTVTAQFRRKPQGTSLRGPVTKFDFTANMDPATSKYIQLQHVSLDSFCSEEKDKAKDFATNFIDGNANTAWHTKWGQEDKQRFYTVKFDKPRYINKIEYMPTGGENGTFKTVNVLVSMDGQKWTRVKTYVSLTQDYELKTIPLDDSIQAQYVKIEAVETYNKNPDDINWYVSGSMLNFYEDTTK